MELSKVVQAIEGFADKSLAEDWDNVGLLIQPSSQMTVRKIALTNDLTLAVMHECVQAKADLIISYHPPIFKPLKCLTPRSWKEEVVISCIKNNIALYSPHTAFDAVEGGVNDWLISPFGKGTILPINQSTSLENGLTHQVTFVIDRNYSHVAFSILTMVPGIAVDNTNATEHLTISCSEQMLPEMMKVFWENHGVFKDVRIVKLEKRPINAAGSGRKITLDTPLTLEEAVSRTKDHLKLPHVRLATVNGGSTDTLVKTVAVCAGSGASVLRGVRADLLVTGEMSHHDVLDAVHHGSSVILCEHSNTERGFLKDFSKKLEKLLCNQVEVFTATKDFERLVVV